MCCFFLKLYFDTIFRDLDRRSFFLFLSDCSGSQSVWGVFLVDDLFEEGQSSGTAVIPRELFLGCIREQAKEEKLRW